MNDYVVFALQFVFVLLPAIIVHEASHGWVALLLGDTTARDRGRLSLNPRAHIDPFGTILLPIILLLSSGGKFSFGYAKPVPINPWRMPNYRTGMLLTGLAGPTSNLAMATFGALLFRALSFANAGGTVGNVAALWALYFVQFNLVLMFFNLIPLPPLDGSRVLPLFLSDRGMQTYARLEQYGILFVFLLVFIVPPLLHVDPLGAYFRVTVMPLLRILLGV